MTTCTPREVRALIRIADGAAPGEDAEVVPRLAAAGLVEVVPPEEVAVVRLSQAQLAEAERLRQRASRGGSRSILGLLLRVLAPGSGPRTRRTARGLREMADELEAQARRALDLGRRRLLTEDLDCLAPGPGGSVLRITDAGRLAARAFLYGPSFVAHEDDTRARRERITRFLRLRMALLDTGFAPDPRVDLAAAIASRSDSEPQRLCELNRLASADGWRSYDRLPLVAGICALPGEVGEVWERFNGVYDCLRQESRMPGSYETRAAAVVLTRHELDAPAVAQRLGEVARRLRRDGWSMGQSTDPVAARLALLPLTPTQIAARVQALFTALKDRPCAGGPLNAYAAAVLAHSSLHPLSPRHTSAKVGSEVSPYAEALSRYDNLIGRPEVPPELRPLCAALLALMPGLPEANHARMLACAGDILPVLGPLNAIPLALALADGFFADWFDGGLFGWEIGCCLELADPTSVFSCLRRISPVMQASRVGAPPPPGPVGSMG